MGLSVVKKVKGGAVLQDAGGKKFVLLEAVRLSHPHLDKPYAGKSKPGENQQTPKYGVVAMLPKKTHKEIKDEIVAIIAELEREAKIKVASDKKFIKNGDDSDKDEYAGHWTVSAREVNPPSLRDKNKRNVERSDAGKLFYGGAWGDVLIRPWVQNNDYGKRINAGLSAVKFVRDDKSFGEGRLSDDDIDDVFGGESDDDLSEDDEDMDL